MPDSTAPDLHQEMTRHIPNLRAFARSLTRRHDAADDLVQETLIKACQHIDQFTVGTNLKAWLFTILRNTYLSDLRKRRHEVEDADGSLSERVSVAASQNAHMDMIDFNKALSALPSEQREALILVGAEGFSYEEAAEMCGCAVGTMKSRVNRARNRLAVDLGLSDRAEATVASDT
ncbi:MAG TPA: sigma-70 family RNA polymerase sigma factor [Hyphomicrobiaceae bacterium]|nr:sigma-70 family RNA polymerase sigma factor [Hyphomicrobiaceae bacterium]